VILRLLIKTPLSWVIFEKIQRILFFTSDTHTIEENEESKKIDHGTSYRRRVVEMSDDGSASYVSAAKSITT
jgi:hypothetical protein